MTTQTAPRLSPPPPLPFTLTHRAPARTGRRRLPTAARETDGRLYLTVRVSALTRVLGLGWDAGHGRGQEDAIANPSGNPRVRGQLKRRDVAQLIRRIGLYGLGTALPVILLAAVSVLAAAGTATAQSGGSSRPGVDCAPLTASQAAYWVKAGLCVTPPQPDPVAVTVAAPPDAGSPDDCRDVNPYADPERAVRCVTRPDPTDATPTFIAGAVYALGYSEVRARVVSVGTDPDGVQVVTVRWLVGTQSLEAFRTPPTPGGRTNWALISVCANCGS